MCDYRNTGGKNRLSQGELNIGVRFSATTKLREPLPSCGKVAHLLALCLSSGCRPSVARARCCCDCITDDACPCSHTHSTWSRCAYECKSRSMLPSLRGAVEALSLSLPLSPFLSPPHSPSFWPLSYTMDSFTSELRFRDRVHEVLVQPLAFLEAVGRPLPFVLLLSTYSIPLGPPSLPFSLQLGLVQRRISREGGGGYA